MLARMNPAFSARWCFLMFGVGGALHAAGADQPATAQTQIEVTNVHQIRMLATQTANTNYVIRLEGHVWWADPAQGRLVLKDDSGAEELQVELSGGFVAPGQRVRLE